MKGVYTMIKLKMLIGGQWVETHTILLHSRGKELLAISVCRDSKNKEFWLLHKLDKVTVSTQVELDLDELNNDLDSLLNS